MHIAGLINWFNSVKREFPWRTNPSPYAVWVSEVMLQQTRASVVVPYFEKWMELFPSIEALAHAPLELVLKTWEGLGYYSRARNLHQGAQYLLANHQGQFPQSFEELHPIKGLGTYTIGAILSFAFHQKIPAVDGNVTRVISRLYNLQEDVCKCSTQQKIRKLVFELLPEEQSWVVNEALIELGALICTKKPLCHACPLQNVCQAFKLQTFQGLPYKSKKMVAEALYRYVAVIQHKDLYLVHKGNPGKIMQDLYEFPYFNKSEVKNLPEHLSKIFNIAFNKTEALSPVKHSFTRFRVALEPLLFYTDQKKDLIGYEWHSKEALLERPFSSGHRKILAQL